MLDLNAHFSGNTLLAADDASRIRSGEVATVNDQRFFNSLVLSMGCHSGYNIVDPDATPGTPRADWAQAFATQGATLVGGTGYQYGNSPFIKYSEVLLDSVTHELRLFDGATPGPVSIGLAVLNAKRAYVHAGMTGIDEKAVAELTLYGLPMYRLNQNRDLIEVAAKRAYAAYITNYQRSIGVSRIATILGARERLKAPDLSRVAVS